MTAKKSLVTSRLGLLALRPFYGVDRLKNVQIILPEKSIIDVLSHRVVHPRLGRDIEVNGLSNYSCHVAQRHLI